MSIPVVVIGAGGFGRETLDVLEAVNAASPTTVFDIRGVVDDAPSDLNRRRLDARGLPLLGTVDEWLASDADSRYLIGIGNPRVRLAIAEKLARAHRIAATAVHPNAGVGSLVVAGEGSVLCAGSQVSTNVTLGRHVHVNPNATIGHDSAVEDFVSINPGAIVSGEVRVRRGALLGAGSVVLQALTIGEFSVVGASACVVRDVSSEAVVKGIPAR